MPRAEIIERLVVERQLKAGMSPTEILVAHYDSLCRRSRTAGCSKMATKYREARDIVALVKPQFFIDIAKVVGVSLVSIVELFKDSKVVRFFQKIGWRMENFWKVLKDGYVAAKKFANTLSEYTAETKVMHWTRDELKKLDAWLDRPENRRTKVLLGVFVAEMLVYLWFLMADTGNIAFDWDLSDAVAALSGSYVLSDIFAGPEGVKFIAVLAAGMVGLTFPWPGPTSVHFIGTVIMTLAKEAKKRLSPAKKPVEEEAQMLGLA